VRVPLARPDVRESDICAVADVMRTPSLSLGPKLEEFERALASYVGVSHGVAVSSGTGALHLCLRALGIGRGDEVIVPSFAFIAVANAVRYVDAIPVFADIDPVTLNLDPERVEASVSPLTRAILVVHTFGCPADLGALGEIARRRGLFLIEDACEALGAEYDGRKVGSHGDAAVFGFYPNKQITTGEGGAVVTRTNETATASRSLRNQGRRHPGVGTAHDEIGFNYRISELNCALGLEQLKRIEGIVAAREALAQGYRERLSGHPDLELPVARVARCRISWFAFVVRLAEPHAGRRERLVERMAERGIACGRYFTPIHLQPAYRSEPHRCGGLAVTQAVARRTLALPFFHQITGAQMDDVCATLTQLLGDPE
jgi:perosamine synthetase